MRVYLLSLSVIMALVIAGASTADDGFVVNFGGTVRLMKPEHTSIRMGEEQVDIVIHGLTADVTCKFVFKNEGPATDVQMGFPDRSANTSVEDEEANPMCIQKFKSWVDGKPMAVSHTKPHNLGSYTFEDYDHNYDSWYVKSVHFNAGQTRVVEDKYTCLAGVDQIRTFALFYYVLKTGASWKGKIGKAVITLDTSGIDSHFRPYDLKPQGYTQKGKKYIWILRNFEPKEDMSFDFASEPRINSCPICFFGQMEHNHAFVRAGSLEDCIYDCNAQVNWDTKTHRCIITLTKKPATGTKQKAQWHSTIEITPGSRKAVRDGHRVVWMKHSPQIEGGRLLVPFADVVRALGGEAGCGKDSYHIYSIFPASGRR